MAIQVWLPLVRIEYVFSFQIWYCELCVKKPIKGRQKLLFWFLLLFFLAFSQLNISWKFELTIDFSLLNFESFKPSLPLFLTIKGKRWIDLSFSLSARFEQLNTAQKPGIFKFLFLFHFVKIIFYSLFSRPLRRIEAQYSKNYLLFFYHKKLELLKYQRKETAKATPIWQKWFLLQYLLQDPCYEFLFIVFLSRIVEFWCKWYIFIYDIYIYVYIYTYIHI